MLRIDRAVYSQYIHSKQSVTARYLQQCCSRHAELSPSKPLSLNKLITASPLLLNCGRRMFSCRHLSRAELGTRTRHTQLGSKENVVSRAGNEPS